MSMELTTSLKSPRNGSPAEHTAIAVDENASVDNEVMNLWLRRARRKFRNGVTVIKVTPTGKLVRRQLYIGAKPEYLELISSKLFDTAYHLSDISTIIHGLQSSDFKAFRELQPDRLPKESKSLVLKIGGQTISLVFQTEADRRDAQILLRVERRLIMKHLAKALETEDAASALIKKS